MSVTHKQKLGQLTDGQIGHFYEKGYIVLKQFFSATELEPCLRAIEELVDVVARKLHKAGKISDLHSDLDVFHRLIALEKDYPGANILLLKTGYLPQAFRDLFSNTRLLNVMEQLIGPNIAGHPVWNIRSKTPRCEAVTVPWHQDNAYLDESVKDTLIPTAWIPLLDCDANNGCLEMVAGGHRSGKLAEHTCCAGNTWYVDLSEEEMCSTLGVDMTRDVVQLPVKYGDFVLFTNLVPHRSLENVSEGIRWSLDLRWQDTHSPSAFYGLKEGVEMRRCGRAVDIDWSGFDAVNRHDKQLESTKPELVKEGIEENEFDLVMSGPWMKRWKIVHHNMHTRGLAV